jgi:hypothetical protein
VVGSCVHGDEPSGSGAMELNRQIVFTDDNSIRAERRLNKIMALILVLSELKNP